MTAAPGMFLESEIGRPLPEDCLFHVIPVPLESTVSYGGGTALGPAAIVAASNQLETWNGRLEPCAAGIHTWAAVDCSGGPVAAMDGLEQAVLRAADTRPGRRTIPVVLGGEHSLTPGAVRALLRLHGREGTADHTARGVVQSPKGAVHQNTVGVIHIDAHADLRAEYGGTPHSHACAMRRVLDLGCPVAQFGVRSLSVDEVRFRRETGLFHLDAREFYERGGLSGLAAPLLPDTFPDAVYISFDVDGLDPSVIPATGTPEPGGLLWYDALGLLQRALRKSNGRPRRVVGFDVVELAPFPASAGQTWPEFAAARLVYELMGLALEHAEM